MRLLDAAWSKMTAPGTPVFTHAEDERLAAALLSVVRRPDFDPTILDPWLARFVALEKQVWSKAPPDPQTLDASQNARNLLRSLHVLLSLPARRCRCGGALPGRAAARRRPGRRCSRPSPRSGSASVTLQPLDWLVVAAYLAAVLFVGLVVVRRQAGAEGYFLAGRQLRWPFIGASMFASNISAEHFVGLAGSGFAIGMAIGGFEWMAVYCIVPLVVLFLPFYVRNRIYTVPEFLERRFSPGVRLLFSGLMVVLSVLTKVSISLWASSIVFSDILGWPRFWVIWGVGLVTCLYTMKGGLRAVVYTDALQTAVLLLAAVVLTALGLQAVGGLVGAAGEAAGRHVLDGPPGHRPRRAVARHVHRRLHPGQLLLVDGPGPRAARLRGEEPRRGTQGRDLLRLPQARRRRSCSSCPGLVAKALHPDLGQADHAFPKLLETLMPTGLRGLTVAGIAAALMGHISATYNSVATLVTRDFYLRFRPEADPARQVRVGTDRRPRRLRAGRCSGPRSSASSARCGSTCRRCRRT